MTVKYECDVCGKRENAQGSFNLAPTDWFKRDDKHICSLECCKKLVDDEQKKGENNETI